jgi:hypothetical protein
MRVRDSQPIDWMVAREGIEPPTRGFSVIFRGFEGLINQSLTALATPNPRPTKAQSWHTQSDLDTFLAHGDWPFLEYYFDQIH